MLNIVSFDVSDNKGRIGVTIGMSHKREASGVLAYIMSTLAVDIMNTSDPTAHVPSESMDFMQNLIVETADEMEVNYYTVEYTTKTNSINNGELNFYVSKKADSSTERGGNRIPTDSYI